MNDNRYQKKEWGESPRPEEILPPGQRSPEMEQNVALAGKGGRSGGGSEGAGNSREVPSGKEHAGVGGPSAANAMTDSTPGAQVEQPAVQAEAAAAVSAQEASSPETGKPSAAEETEQLRAELAQLKDQLLRAYAELDNYRKRVARQMEEERRYSELGLVRDLLPVLDDIYRAIEAGEKAADSSSLLTGIKMVAEHLEQVLARHHCYRIEAEGKRFDPNLHEAVAQQPSDSCPPNTVVQVLRTGYVLHDRVVRPAQVVVSVGTAPAPANN
jgi:molecular chaperone GrpE